MGVGIVEVLPTGWVFIGPVIDLLLGIVDNSAKPGWFEKSKSHATSDRSITSHSAKPSPVGDIGLRLSIT